jgi:hypothetical protein
MRHMFSRIPFSEGEPGKHRHIRFLFLDIIGWRTENAFLFHIVNTTRNSAFPLCILSYASFAFSNG